MTPSKTFARQALYGTTPLCVAIKKFIEADNRSFIHNAMIDEALRNGATQADLTLQLRNAEIATSELQARFETVIETDADDLLDVLKKLQLWSHVTGCSDPTDESASLPDRLVAATTNNLKNVLKRG